MADERKSAPAQQQQQRPKKADVIIKNGREMSAKLDELLNASKLTKADLEALLAKIEEEKQTLSSGVDKIIGTSDEVKTALEDDYNALKQELRYLAIQNESIFESINGKMQQLEDAVAGAEPREEKTAEEKPAAEPSQPVEIDYDVLADKVAERIPAPRAVAEVEPVIDYDVLADKVAERIPAPQAVAEVEPVIDYDVLADKVAERIPAPQAVSEVAAAEPAEIDYDALAGKLAERIPAPVAQVTAIPAAMPAEVRAEVDYEKIAEQVCLRLPAQEIAVAAVEPVPVAVNDVDYDLLANKIAELLPAAERTAEVSAEIDYDVLAEKVAERLPAPRSAEPVIDYDVIVDKLVARMPAQQATPAEIDYDEIARRVALYTPVPSQVVEAPAQVDYDYLVERFAATVPAQTVAEPAQIDIDELARKVAEIVPASQPVAFAAAAPVEIDGDELADKVVSRIPLQESYSPDYIASRVAEQLVIPAQSAEIDYETLAQTIADKLALPDLNVDGDYIAEKVADKITIPEAVAQVDNDYIAERVLERINAATETGNIDCEYIANKVAEQLEVPEVTFDYEYLAHKVAECMPAPEVNYGTAAVSAYDVNEDELADAIALKLGTIKPEDYEILVDDEGCGSISKEIADRLDYELISSAVAEKLRAAMIEDEAEEPDYEEMATRISEKITVAGVNEDAIADKAAAVLSNYLPDFDTDEIADKVAEQVISAMPAVDHDALTESISARLIESQEENDYDIVLDDEGLDRVSDSVSEKIILSSDERFTSLDNSVDERFASLNTELDDRFTAVEREIAEIKELLANGVTVHTETAAASAYEVTEESLVTVADIIAGSYEEEPEVIEEPAEEGVVEKVTEEPAEEEVIEEVTEEPAEEEVVEEETEEPAEEEVVEEETEEPVEEEVVEEVIEEPVEEEVVEEVTEEPVEEEVVEEVTEEPVEEEVVEDETEEGEDDNDGGDESEDGEEGEEGEGGVDFANMMRYNRSFIARIIQSTDDQKKYYGEVRNTLLSYRKVNSNIAWGAERFHKGRETIARFKIRGKTLVLYLALDPKTHEISVYHHKDVSSNKSLHGTPMMVKIKSPLGVKKAVRLIDEMLEARDGVKRNVPTRDYAAMYPYESIEELIEDGLVKDVKKK